MDLLRKTLTRRAALGGSAAGLALTAVGWWWSRSTTPIAARYQAAVSEAPASTLAGAPVAATTAGAPAAVPGASATAASAGPRPVDPDGGAGLFDVDPDQSSVNQDPHVEVTSDIAALPLDMEL